MKRNSTYACCLWALVGMYWSFGGTVNATLDSTDNPENNVPWIFDMSKIKVPLVSVTQEQQMQERTYLEHLQIAKNLTVMTVTALEVALPPVVKNDLAGIDVVQQSKGIANEQNTLLYNLFVKYNDIHAVGEDICNDLKVPPVTRYLQLPTGDDAVEIQDLEAYTNNITDNVIDKLIRFFDQLYNANQIVSQVKMLKVVSSDVLIDKATAGLISRLGEVYHVTPNDKYKTATQKGILEAAMHEPNEIRVIKRWLNIKRNELHRIAEFITSAPAKQKMEEFKVSRPTVYLQMLDIYSLWFELFRVVYNQSYLLYNLDLFRNSVIEMVKKEDCPRSIIMAAAKGMDMIYTNTEYHKLGPKQRALLEKKLLNVRYMARKSYILPPYTLCLTRHNVLVKDFDTPTAYKADTVELSCVMEHLTNEYYYINYAAQEMQDNVKYMNKLKRKIGITDTQLVQNRVMTTRIAETIGNVLEDTERGITHIWRDVEQMGGNAEQVANPTAVLNQAFQIGSCLSRLAMMILEVYKNRCDIYTCSTQYKTISMPTRFIDDTTLLADKARQGLTDILPGYRNFRAMTIHIKNRAKIAQEDLEKRLGQPIYGVRQEIMRYRGAVDTVLRYFANVEAYRYDLNKFGSVVSRTKKLPPIQRNYEIFKAYCYASRAISDTLLLQRSLPIIQELRRQFDEFVNKVRKYKLERDLNQAVMRKPSVWVVTRW
ncbi:hypothetical protein BaOVIS_001410 [Babesia ovis]|uniref:Uncharacterized protein n=1 Tax=Babesia ovis TaxID=5869 RepID=A0A9W5WTZ1_BABOV|nr:hypothetical protein BaOVIS_001410 [Babesia ovis]